MKLSGLIFALIAVALMAVGVAPAMAEPAASAPNVVLAKGLWLEQSTMADGVTVRRIRDNGEGVICYVASYASPYTQGAGISCVRDIKAGIP